MGSKLSLVETITLPDNTPDSIFCPTPPHVIGEAILRVPTDDLVYAAKRASSTIHSQIVFGGKQVVCQTKPVSSLGFSKHQAAVERLQAAYHMTR
jgi:hypothetical protein